jgi:hypothetical protein
MKAHHIALLILLTGILMTASLRHPGAQAADLNGGRTAEPIFTSQLPQGGLEGSGQVVGAWSLADGTAFPPDGRGPRDLVAEWTYAIGAATLSAPRIADLDGDGTQDIIVTTYDPDDPYSAGLVNVLDMNGRPLPGWPTTTVGPIPASAAIADIDNNGDMELVVGSWYHAYVWNHDGTAYPNWPKSVGTNNSPSVADLDGDGDLEIIYSTTGKQLYVWHHDGTTFSGWPYTAPELVNSPSVADIDGDGDLEIAGGTYEGPVGPDPFEVYVWEADGTVLGGFPVATSGVVKGAVALGDIDLDGGVEIIAGAYDTSDDDHVYAWDAAGNLKAGWPVTARYSRLSSPTLGDLDGDSDLEVVIGGRLTGSLEEVFAFHHDGTAVAGFPVVLTHPSPPSGSVNSSAIIADIDGDPGQVELVVKARDYICAIHADGTTVDGFPFYLTDEGHTGTFSPSPAVGDLDDDGDVEYVFVSNNGLVAFFDEPHTFSADLAYWPMFKHDAHNTGYLPPMFAPGDCDLDRDVDLVDFSGFQACFTGEEGGPVDPDCTCYDMERDDDVDLVDYDVMFDALTGPQ